MTSDELNDYFRFVSAAFPHASFFVPRVHRQHAPRLGASALQKALAQVAWPRS
jgi:hypothetical protein